MAAIEDEIDKGLTNPHNIQKFHKNRIDSNTWYMPHMDYGLTDLEPKLFLYVYTIFFTLSTIILPHAPIQSFPLVVKKQTKF